MWPQHRAYGNQTSRKRGFEGKMKLIVTNKSLPYLVCGLESESNKEAPDISKSVGRMQTGTAYTVQLAATLSSTPPLLSTHELPWQFLEFLKHWHKLLPHLLFSSSIPAAAWLPSSSFGSSFNITSSGPVLPHPPAMAAPNRPAHFLPQATSLTRLSSGQDDKHQDRQTRCVLPGCHVLKMCD